VDRVEVEDVEAVLAGRPLEQPLVEGLTGAEVLASLPDDREWVWHLSKARNQIGFEAEVAWREGLERTVEWTRENLDWIESCIESAAPKQLVYGQKTSLRVVLLVGERSSASEVTEAIPSKVTGPAQKT